MEVTFRKTVDEVYEIVSLVNASPRYVGEELVEQKACKVQSQEGVQVHTVKSFETGTTQKFDGLNFSEDVQRGDSTLLGYISPEMFRR